jgi:hypothetical protein
MIAMKWSKQKTIAMKWPPVKTGNDPHGMVMTKMGMITMNWQ